MGPLQLFLSLIILQHICKLYNKNNFFHTTKKLFSILNDSPAKHMHHAMSFVHTIMER